MSQYPPYEPEIVAKPFAYQPKMLPPPQENGFGIAGFITSIIGLISCGSLSIFGVILSAIGLRKEPKGLAVAGLILGLVGIVELVGVIFLMFFAVRTTTVAVQGMQHFAANAQLAVEAMHVAEDWKTKDRLPSQTEGDTIVAGHRDIWGKQIVYETDGFTFSLRSPGPDGVLLNDDDVVAGPFADPDEVQQQGMNDFGLDLEELKKELEIELPHGLPNEIPVPGDAKDIH